MAAIAGNVDFLEGESVHQHALNFIIFHGIFNHQLINQRNILEQSCAGINKQKSLADKSDKARLAGRFAGQAVNAISGLKKI
ncbi:hypothetical protein KZ774_05695 [Escherichia coli]|nr:hypothetical protein [Escherichia coli]